MIFPSLTTGTLLFSLYNFSSVLPPNEITYHQVIIYRRPNGVLPSKHPNTFTAADVTDYDTSRKSDFDKPYITVEFPHSLLNNFQTFIVGNNIITNRSMKSVNDKNLKKGYRNGELVSKTYYTGFHRACVNDSFCQSTSWYQAAKTRSKPKKIEDVDSTMIVAVVLGVTAGILVLLFLPMYYAHLRSKKTFIEEKRPAPTAPPPKSNPFAADPKLPVQHADFPDHLSRLRLDDNANYVKEFSLLDRGIKNKHTEFSKPENLEKSRYCDIPAYDKTRVTLQTVNGNPMTDFIHANFVGNDHNESAYIATQSPLPGTMPDFWRMVWEYNVETIVMLNNLVEKEEQVCSQYWPNEGETKEYNDMVVTHKEVNEFACYLVRTFEVKKGNEDLSLLVKQFHYTDWPGSREVPRHPLPLVDFIRRVLAYSETSQAPIVVHCISGTSRTAIFMAVSNQLKNVDEKAGISIFNDVQEICEQRCQAIKTMTEYMFIHDCVLEYYFYTDMADMPEDTFLDCVQSTNMYLGVGETKFQSEFNNMKRRNSKLDDISQVGTLPRNTAKNRHNSLVPFEATRVVLKTSTSSAEDYINASFIDSYRAKNHFIATQAPIANTIPDFWRMIWEQRVRSIAALLEQQTFSPDEIYWPNEGESLTIEDLKIKHVSYKDEKSFGLREISILNTKSNEKRQLRLYHLIKWADDPSTEKIDLYNLIVMIRECKSWTEAVKGTKSVVHCSTGCGRSGIFIALSNAIDQMEIDKFVNIFYITRRMRLQRQDLIQTQEEYQLIYRGAAVYFKNFSSVSALFGRRRSSDRSITDGGERRELSSILPDILRRSSYQGNGHILPIVSNVKRHSLAVDRTSYDVGIDVVVDLVE